MLFILGWLVRRCHCILKR